MARDDRGVRREIGKIAFSEDDDALDAIDDTARSIADDDQWHDPVSIGGVAAVFGPTAAWVLGIVLLIRAGFPWWMWLLVLPVAIAAIAYPLTRRLREKRRDKVVQTYLDGGRCATCGYVLSPDRVENDGCVVCSECGAGWKRERIGEVRGV